MLVRASIGTLAKLGLADIKIIDEPRTAYFLQYSENGCLGKCRFCNQSRSSRAGKDWLGKVTWPPVELATVLDSWRDVFDRVCFQTIIKQGFIEEARVFIREITRVSNLPVSLAITPVSKSILREFKELGVDKLGVGLDTVTEELFTKWGKPYTWRIYWRFIEEAVDVFGEGNVYVHIIVGLGESLREALETIIKIYSKGARVALFNYFDSSNMKSIDKRYYRIIQLAVELIENGEDPLEYIDLDSMRFKQQPGIDVYEALYTRGCPGCNRPFYTDLPRVIYNFPSRKILEKHRNEIMRELESIGVKA
ncbi:MAG: radical SAM protein [Desulfurococcus sp.]|uniref:radical SAM protein n=1 Tax=Desulfurococcus sp. TaxID=51678 RepID=UPI003D146FA7